MVDDGRRLGAAGADGMRGEEGRTLAIPLRIVPASARRRPLGIVARLALGVPRDGDAAALPRRMNAAA